MSRYWEEQNEIKERNERKVSLLRKNVIFIDNKRPTFKKSRL